MSFIAGMSRPARGTGLALLGVAVIAAVIGGVTLLTGDDDGGDVAGGPTGTSQAPNGGTTAPGRTTGQGTTPGAPTSPTSPTSPESTTTTTTRPGAPSGPGNGDGSGGQDGTGRAPRDSVRSVSVRVYNNSNIENLASRAAADMRGQGWKVPEVSNYPWGIIRTTTAYYRPGTAEKAAAYSLASSFGMRARPRFDGIKDASPGVIVIVTKDYGGPSGKSG